MADFCKQCSIKLFGEDFGDLSDLCKPDELVGVLCEGCGGTVVDHTGTCLTDCLLHHHPEKNDAQG